MAYKTPTNIILHKSKEVIFYIPNNKVKIDIDLWVKEAMELRPQIYDMRDDENLSYEYMYRNWETVRKQLLKGGLRLAALLNEIYG